MITVRVTNRLEVGQIDRLPAHVLKQIKNRLSLQNPAYLEAEKRGFWTGNLEREIKGYEVDGDRLIIPRELMGILHRAGVRFQMEDRRRVLPEVAFEFLGTLKDFQQGPWQAGILEP